MEAWLKPTLDHLWQIAGKYFEHIPQILNLSKSSWHVFTHFLNANLPTFLTIILRKENCYCPKEVFFLIFEHLIKFKKIFRNIWWKNFVDSYSENSWKHVMSSTFVGESLRINTKSTWSNCIHTIFSQQFLLRHKILDFIEYPLK